MTFHHYEHRIHFIVSFATFQRVGAVLLCPRVCRQLAAGYFGSRLPWVDNYTGCYCLFFHTAFPLVSV